MEKDLSQISRNILSDIVVYMKYAKYIPELKRRETWYELVYRNREMHLKKFPELEAEIYEAYQFVFDKKVLPSMRMAQFSGRPIEISPIRGYNCSFCAVDDWRFFNEAMLLLLSGTGVGFSVQKHHVEKLPEVKGPNKKSTKRFLISDSIEGWADAVKVLMQSYFFGKSQIRFDFSDIREKGALLVTSGGKAPGPEPLKVCLFNVEKVLSRKEPNEKLSTLEVHDIVCYIADAVRSGGVRRSSLISLFNIDDEEMLACKSGNWWEDNPQRALANNSAVMVRHKLDEEIFRAVLKRTELSKAGEPGIFLTNDKEISTNPCCVTLDTQITTTEGRKSAKELIGVPFVAVLGGKEYKSKGFWTTGIKSVYRLTLENGYNVKLTLDHLVETLNGWKESLDLDSSDEVLINVSLKQNETSRFQSLKLAGIEEVCDVNVPKISKFEGNGISLHNCEISLKSNQFCNLTTINGSNLVDQKDFEERCAAASIIGTLQASYTDFHYLRPAWKKVTEKESLLGVSITGNANYNFEKIDLSSGAKVILATNRKIAKKIGINPAARTTCQKPDGTTSLVLGTSSGIHAWFADFYIRRLRVGKDESIYKYLKLNHPELVEDDYFKPKTEAIISVPMKAPKGAIIRTEPPLELLKRVKRVYQTWVKPGHVSGSNTHNVSVTVSVKDDEWDQVADWMWTNRDSYSGISLLPYDGGTYKQAPFEEITEERFNELASKLTEIDLSEIIEYDDNTDLQGENACGGSGSCEIK